MAFGTAKFFGVPREKVRVISKEEYDEATEESNNDTNPAYKMVKVDRLIEIMRQDGYEDAAEYLEKKVS